MARLNIIGLMGNAKAGKSTSAGFMVAGGKGKVIAFADKLKEVVTDVFDLPPDACYDDLAKESKTTFPCLVCPRCTSLRIETLKRMGNELASCMLCGTTGELGVFKSFWTPRMILQHIGTEGFRAVYDKVWAAVGIRAAKKALEEGAEFVVIQDTRFRSECKAIWDVGGEVWRLKRPSAEGNVGLAGHASETEQGSILDSDLQAVIQNDSTLEELRHRVTVQLEHFLAGRALAA
jgi:hypothetical protein